jgi:protein-disulfide isomerase
VIPDLIEQYVDTGKARFVYREYPLSSIHPAAQKASEAAVCAGKQGKYWEMNEHLFDTSSEWGAQGADLSGSLKGYAGELGLDAEAFANCLDSGEGAAVVKGDQMLGESLGVNATPYFFINDLPIRGGLPIEALGRIIDYVAAGGTTPEIVPGADDFHVRGDSTTAKALAVAFVDYASSDSAKHANEVLPRLMAQYVDQGQLLYILHPWADGPDSPSAQGAAAAECAGQQGKFWEMHSQLFEDQDAWTASSQPTEVFAGYAASAELDTDAFVECLDSDWADLRVQAGPVVGSLYGVPGAPVFLFNNGEGQEGSPTFEEFQKVIESILGGQ